MMVTLMVEAYVMICGTHMHHIYGHWLHQDKTIGNHQPHHHVFLHKHHSLEVYCKLRDENFYDNCSNHKAKGFHLKGQTTNNHPHGSP
jgi:hypothetical protein